MSRTIEAFLIVLCLSCGVQSQEVDELLVNPDFEDPFDGNDWYAIGGTLEQDTDAFSGDYSGRISNRQAEWASISQDVSLQQNTNYYFTAHIKLTEMLEGALWHSALLQIELNYADGTADYITAGRLPYLRQDQGWQKIGGDFYIGQQDVERFRAFIQVNTDGDVLGTFLVDLASLKPYYVSRDWKAEAYLRIEELRKNFVLLNVNIGGGYDPTELEIQVSQTSQSYPFGTAIVDGQIAGDSDYNQKYQDTFYSNFNWAVFENALKWQAMEKEREVINYPDESVSRLNAAGIPTRGHCVFWGVEQFVPPWLLDATPEQLESEIQRRIDYVVPRYAGQLIHWDVNNEQEHGPWFEEKLSNPTVMNDMFTEVRSRDENVVLFLNDYEIVSGSQYTQSYVNKALEVNAATGLVGGIGAQSHLQGTPDIAGLQKRLEVITGSGFPVWITELDIEIENRNDRANAYDDVVTLYYSTPGVDGILLWGFSDNHHWRPNCALFEGDDFTPNAAGLRWQEMMFQRWRSFEVFYPQSTEQSFGFSGFHGFYKVEVYNGEDVIISQEFEIPVGQDIAVNITVGS